MDYQELVSIAVITYNSSAYIIDGLESIKSQTYKNIELIISDDCSTDNTIDLCRDWLEKNKSRFRRTLLVTTEKNTGVAGNCNRAIRPCQGEWIKMLSGDDKFLPNTIDGYMEYITAHRDVNICFAKFHFYSEDEEYVKNASQYYEKEFYPLIKASWGKQYRENLKRLFVPGPGLFYRKSLWERVGGFDERYPFCEEDPFTYNVLRLGYRIYFIDRELYSYHIRKDSLCRTSGLFLSSRHEYDRYRYFIDERRKNMIRKGMLFNALYMTLKYKTEISKMNNSYFMMVIYKLLSLLTLIFLPLKVLKFIKDKIYLRTNPVG